MMTRAPNVGGTSLNRSLQTRVGQIAIAAACLAVLALGLYRHIAPASEYVISHDFTNNYNAAMAIRVGTSPYVEALAWVQGYAPGAPLEDYYFYAPTFAVLLIPFTFLPYVAAASVWGLCTTAFLFGSIYALLRSTGSRPSWVTLLLLATAASLMSAVRLEYALGQANLFMAASLCLAIWARQTQRSALAGLLLAFALVTKPMLLLLVVFFLWKREFKFTVTALAAFLVLFLSPFIVLGSRVLVDLLIIWHFYSAQYLSFLENIAPRGMLDRLFTLNPVVRPLIVAPALATAVWLVIAAGVLLLALAVIAPRPIQRDSRSLLEFGVMIAAVLIISPLTEPAYLVLLVVPMLGTFIYLQRVHWGRPAFPWASIAFLCLWLIELVPRQFSENFFRSRISTASAMADLYVTLAPVQFYIMAAVFLLQLHVLALASGTPTTQAVHRFVRHSPTLLREWFTDLWLALRQSTRVNQQSWNPKRELTRPPVPERNPRPNETGAARSVSQLPG